MKPFNYKRPHMIPDFVKKACEQVMRKSYQPRFVISYSDLGCGDYMVCIDTAHDYKYFDYAQIIYYAERDMYELSSPNTCFDRAVIGNNALNFGYFKTLKGALANIMGGNATKEEKTPLVLFN